MGEETTFAGLGDTICFCRRENIGTENEQWHEAKLDSFRVREKIEMSELDTDKMEDDKPEGGRKGFTNTFTLNLEPSEETKQNLIRLHRKIRKHQSGSRHYALSLITKRQWRAIRKVQSIIKKHKLRRK